MLKLTIILTAILLLSCSKEYLPDCQRIYVLVDKYNGDTSYWKTDTLRPWGENNLFCKADTMWAHDYKPVLLGCNPLGFELVRYVIGNKITYPTIFKKKL